MFKACLTALSLLAALAAPAREVLIVADEFPAMKIVADALKAQENIGATVIAQSALPPALDAYAAVLVYIHLKLDPRVEQALVRYTEAGGRLVVLHHSISSGKRTNELWFPFLGVKLPPGDVNQGGYKWTEGVTIDVVNLAPGHFLTTNQVAWPTNISFGGEERPGISFHDSEVYLNHTLALGPRTTLLGLRYRDAKTGRVWEQRTAGWEKPAGKGRVVYLMPGHSIREFQEPAFVRLVLNAVIWR